MAMLTTTAPHFPRIRVRPRSQAGDHHRADGEAGAPVAGEGSLR
jgi:hypothetical protein